MQRCLVGLIALVLMIFVVATPVEASRFRVWPGGCEGYGCGSYGWDCPGGCSWNGCGWGWVYPLYGCGYGYPSYGYGYCSPYSGCGYYLPSRSCAPWGCGSSDWLARNGVGWGGYGSGGYGW